MTASCAQSLHVFASAPRALSTASYHIHPENKLHATQLLKPPKQLLMGTEATLTVKKDQFQENLTEIVPKKSLGSQN